MRASKVVEDMNTCADARHAMGCNQTKTTDSSPEHSRPAATRKPKNPSKGEPRSKKLGKHEVSRALDEAEKRRRAVAELKALKAEHRKLRLHCIRKAKGRLQRMEEAIKKEGAEGGNPTVPLDQLVTEVIRNLEVTRIEKIDQELQKHVDRIQALCAKLGK